MAVQQALAYYTVYSTSPVLIDFTSNFVTHEAAGSGSDPASGSDLIIVTKQPFGADNVTGVATHNGTSTVTSATEDYDAGSGLSFWRVAGIGSGITGIQVTMSAEGGLFCWVIESDSTLTENVSANTAYASDGDGFTTTHDFPYTTDVANELVIAVGVSTGNATSWTGTSGTNAVAFSTSTLQALLYKDVATAASGTVNWTVGASNTCSAGLTSYETGGGGGGTANPWYYYAQQ